MFMEVPDGVLTVYTRLQTGFQNNNNEVFVSCTGHGPIGGL